MWNWYPNWQRGAAFGGILAVALAIAAGAGSAFAQSTDDDDVPLDTKLFRNFMKQLGFKDGDVGVEYHERAPLVVPPSRNLPPPQDEAPVARNPAWPKDPDVARRREQRRKRRSSDAPPMTPPRRTRERCVRTS
jgi:hypothetical protein